MVNTVSKKAILESLEQMPENVKVDDFLNSIMLLAKIEKGIKDSEEGKLTSQEDVEKMVNKWFE